MLVWMATLQYYYAEYAALPKPGRASRGSQNIKAEKKLLLPGPNNRIRKGGNNLRRRGTLYTTHTEKNLLDFTVYTTEERYKNRRRRRGPFLYFFPVLRCQRSECCQILLSYSGRAIQPKARRWMLKFATVKKWNFIMPLASLTHSLSQ